MYYGISNRLIVLSFLLLITFTYFTQTRSVNLGSVTMQLPEIAGYVECANNKISNRYSKDLIPEGCQMIGFYLNNDAYKYPELSYQYEGFNDFGYLMVFDGYKKEDIDSFTFNYFIDYQDSIYGKVNRGMFKELNDENTELFGQYIPSSVLIDTFSYERKIKSYVHVFSADSLNIYCYFENFLHVNNRLVLFDYYVALKDHSYLNKAKRNNIYFLHNLIQSNAEINSAKVLDVKHVDYKSFNKDNFYTKDGYNMGSVSAFSSYLTKDEKKLDIYGIKIDPVNFWECIAEISIPTLNSVEIEKAIKKNDLSILFENQMDEIMHCLEDGFSVGESYIDLCIQRYMSSQLYSATESRQYCNCEYEKLKVKVNNYQDYKSYYEEIGDQNKPSYNEVILPCRNTIKKDNSANQYVSTDIEGFSDQSIIKLTPDGTTFKIKLVINGIVRYLIFDTGASELVINSELEKELLENGSISPSDYVSAKRFEIADGSVIEARGVRLSSLIMGGYKVKNVVAYITDDGGMLCGMGLMNKFQKWELDKQAQMLTVYK